MNGHSSSSRKPSIAARSCGAVTAAVVGIALFVAIPSAQAQEMGRTFALSAFGGYNVASDIYNDVGGKASLELKNSFMWGGRATAFTSHYSAVEFAYTRNGADLAIKNPSVGVPPGFNAGTLTADEYDINFLVSQPAPNPKLWPYFTLGFGWTGVNPNVTAVNLAGQTVSAKSNTLFAWNFGIGTMAEVNPKLALRLDARWRVTDTAITTSSGVYCDYWGYCWGYSSDWYNSGEFTAGLSYKLGR